MNQHVISSLPFTRNTCEMFDRSLGYFEAHNTEQIQAVLRAMHNCFLSFGASNVVEPTLTQTNNRILILNFR